MQRIYEMTSRARKSVIGCSEEVIKDVEIVASGLEEFELARWKKQFIGPTDDGPRYAGPRLEYEGLSCFYCGRRTGPYHMDHIFPKSRGGTNDKSNMAVVCAPCNHSKLNRTPEEWKEAQQRWTAFIKPLEEGYVRKGGQNPTSKVQSRPAPPPPWGAIGEIKS